MLTAYTSGSIAVRVALNAIGEAPFGLARALIRYQIGHRAGEVRSGSLERLLPVASIVKTAVFHLLHLARRDTDNAILVGVCEECSKKDNGELLEIEYRDCRKMGLAKSKMHVGRA
jgi:hypothetical protein